MLYHLSQAPPWCVLVYIAASTPTISPPLLSSSSLPHSTTSLLIASHHVNYIHTYIHRPPRPSRFMPFHRTQTIHEQGINTAHSTRVGQVPFLSLSLGGFIFAPPYFTLYDIEPSIHIRTGCPPTPPPKEGKGGGRLEVLEYKVGTHISMWVYSLSSYPL